MVNCSGMKMLGREILDGTALKLDKEVICSHHKISECFAHCPEIVL